MKIALVAPIEETVPPSAYGGTELIVYHLAHGMARRGHQVDLYAVGGSPREKGYTLRSIAPKSLRTQPRYHDLKLRETAKWLSLADTVAALNGERYDVIHNHASWRFLVFADLLKNKKIITTHHDPLSLQYRNEVFNRYRQLGHVSISDNQRRDLEGINYIDTIYNGIDLDSYPFAERSGKHDYAYFLARISPEKGVLAAARAARQAKHRLVMNGKVDAVDEAYFAELGPLMQSKYVDFRGEIGGAAKARNLQRARCLLAPTSWEEPFGLMFVEAMASGTPVISYARGSAPEIIEDGKTGFLVNFSKKHVRGSWHVSKTGEEGLVDALKKMFSLPDEEYLEMRKASRRRVEEHFSVTQMLEGYEAAYRTIAG
ncbi:MAG: glycosyltransferase family 4 protein [bacterium]|nr:glycosyltransferase family 4 protein [bacterium]